MDKPNFKKICLMYMQQLTNFPYIEKDFDAITDYELLCKVVNHLNEVISNTNYQNEVISNLYNAFVALKDYVDTYFENLDVQDEINNKLDAMVEDGTLQEIITSYLNSKAVFCFDNVNSMKNSTNLIDGSYAKTLGYYALNDNGGATYKIREITNSDVIDNMTIIPIGEDDLIAELIIPLIINPDMLGAYGDGTHDDLIPIQKAISLGNTQLSNGKTYMVSDVITITNDYSFDSNNSLIKYNGEETAEDYLFVINITGSRLLQRGNNINIRIDCDEKINGVNLVSTIGNNINVVIYNAAYGLKIGSGTNCFENNISAQIDYYKGYGEVGATVLRPDNIFTDLTVMNYKTALYNIGTTSYNNFHAWIDRNAKDIYNISTMIEDASNGTGAFISYFYCDTYRIGVKTSNYAYVHIVEYFIVVNKNEIGDEILLANPVYTFKRTNSTGQLLVDYLLSYETYAYLHIIDTTTNDNTSYIVRKGTLSADVNSKMAIKEVVFPVGITDTTSVVFSKLPQTLQNAYNDGVIYLAPYGKNGTLGFIATHYQQARIYLYYGSDVANIAQWRKIQSEYV